MAAGVSVNRWSVCGVYFMASVLYLAVLSTWSLEMSLLQDFQATTRDPFICPQDCMCQRYNQTVNSLPQYSVVCTVPYISSSRRATSNMINSTSTPQTARLNITCTYSQINQQDESPISELWDGAFEAMTGLRQLVFDKCAFQKLTRSAFEGLMYLKILTVQFANIKELDANLLSNMRLLEQLEISHSSLKKLFPLCAYNSLQSLNLSFNQLMSFDDLGINCDGKFLQKLEQLDISNNLIKVIPRWLSENLPNLHYLFMSGNLIFKYDFYPFKNFANLFHLDISNNSLTELREDFLKGCSNLQFLTLSRNPVSSIQGHFLASVPNLVELEMEQMRLRDNIWLEISELDQYHLRVLDLSNNELTKINENTLLNLRLELLNLSSNRISVISKNLFLSQSNLKVLDLSNNVITIMPLEFSQDLIKLTHLYLQHNTIMSVKSDSFNGLRRLEILDISWNKLYDLPSKSFASAVNISYVDLSNNQLDMLDKDIFSKCRQLRHLNVSFNQLKELPLLSNCEALQIVDSSNNSLTTILPQTFNSLKELHTVSLRNNRLTSLPFRMFRSCDSLRTIDLSFNFLTTLEDDIFVSSPKVTNIDLSHNQLTAMNKVFRDLNHLKTLLLSYNKISQVIKYQVPNSLENLDLSNNIINHIFDNTFKTLTSLRYVDLSVNNLTSLSRGQVEIALNMMYSPTFNLLYNPFVCDCRMGWLKDWYDGKVKDMGTLPTFRMFYSCQSALYSYKRSFDTLKREDFLCHYSQTCEDQCVCCEFDACFCKFICPPSCQCYMGDKFLNIHKVQCSGANFHEVPSQIPEGATHLRLDGNNITVMQEHKFIALKYLQELYLNNSRIHTIGNNSFRGLRSLKVLYLNDNFLTVIESGVFRGLDYLERLYLQNNSIVYIDSWALLSPPNLHTINLRDNKFTTPPLEFLWNFTNRSKENGLKVQLSLSRNPFSCDLDSVCKLVQFMKANSDSLDDISFIECVSSGKVDASYQEFPLLDFQQQLCSENQSTAANMSKNSVQTSSTKAEMYALIAACVVIAFALALLIVAYMNRDFLQVLCFTRFGLRVFKMAKAADDHERLYDAFISYSSKDEDFVVHQLAPRLEDGDKKFQLCLHYRDFPIGACIAETIVRSVEASKRTILVISDNFLDSEWCRFEFQTAHQQVLSERRNRVIIILMHDLDTEKLDNKLKMYMRSRTYLKYDDPWFWEKLMFAMPDVRQRKQEPVPCPLHARGGVVEYMPQSNLLQHPHHRRVPGSITGSRCETIHNDMYEIPILDTCSIHYQLANGRCCSTHTNSAYHNSDFSDSTSGFHNGSVCGSCGHYEEVGPGSSSMQSTPHKFVGTPPPVPSIPKEGFLPVGRVVKTAYV